MHVYPENALTQLEFDKVAAILLNYCQTPIGWRYPVIELITSGAVPMLRTL